MSAADRSIRSVFVGNIPYEITEEKLKDIFSEVGPVISFRLVFDRDSGKPKGYGFCEYQDQETALSAMRNLNGYELNGRSLRVDNATSEKNREELKTALQQSQPPPESPYGDAVAPQEAPEAISRAVASLPPEQMYEVMKQMKIVIQNNPVEARNMLLQNPQLAYALLQAQVVMRIVDPNVAMTLLHRQTDAPQPLIPPEAMNQGPGPGPGPGPRDNQPMMGGNQGMGMGMGGPRPDRPMGPGGPRQDHGMGPSGPRSDHHMGPGGPGGMGPRGMNPNMNQGPGGPRGMGQRGMGQQDMGPHGGMGPNERNMQGGMGHGMGQQEMNRGGMGSQDMNRGIGPQDMNRGGMGPQDMNRGVGPQDMNRGVGPQDMNRGVGPQDMNRGGMGPHDMNRGNMGPGSMNQGMGMNRGGMDMGRGGGGGGPGINSPDMNRGMGPGQGPKGMMDQGRMNVGPGGGPGPDMPMNRGGMQSGPRGVGPEGMGHDPRRADPRGGGGGGFDRGEPHSMGGPGGMRSGDPRMGDPRGQDRPLPSAASISALAANTQPTAQDQEKAALIMQVLQLSPEQINLLPPEQRASIMVLKEQISRSQGGLPT